MLRRPGARGGRAPPLDDGADDDPRDTVPWGLRLYLCVAMVITASGSVLALLTRMRGGPPPPEIRLFASPTDAPGANVSAPAAPVEPDFTLPPEPIADAVDAAGGISLSRLWQPHPWWASRWASRP